MQFFWPKLRTSWISQSKIGSTNRVISSWFFLGLSGMCWSVSHTFVDVMNFTSRYRFKPDLTSKPLKFHLMQPKPTQCIVIELDPWILASFDPAQGLLAEPKYEPIRLSWISELYNVSCIETHLCWVEPPPKHQQLQASFFFSPFWFTLKIGPVGMISLKFYSMEA